MRRSIVAVALALCAQPAFAQARFGDDGPWLGRARISLSAGLQPDGRGSSQETTLQINVEDTPLTAVVANGLAPFFDVGLAVPIAGSLGLTFGFSALITEGTAAVNAQVPHPFFFNQPRTVSGNASGLQRMEMGAHAGLGYLVAAGQIDLLISGGASLFRLQQDIVTDIAVNEEYPYDSATFAGATLSETSASYIGYHAAADLTWRFSRVWGIGVLVRYSRADVPLVTSDVDTGTVVAGGLEAAAGLRFIIP